MARRGVSRHAGSAGLTPQPGGRPHEPQGVLEARHGIGILSTADAGGRADTAVYSRPRVFDDGSVAFVMRKRLTHHNVSQNPHAAYLFLEEGSRLGGIRLFLRKLREETDHALIASMTRRHLTAEEDSAKGPKFLVTFAIERVLPLVGGGEPGGTP